MLRVLGCAINQGRFTAPEVDVNGKNVVVTGPSLGGIGYDTALGLAGFGANIYLAARNKAKAEAAAAAIHEKYPQAHVEVLQCDLSDLDSVRAVAKTIKARVKPEVDVLVANAGAQTSEPTKTKEGVELTFAACALGHHLLAQLAQPKRLVTVTGDRYAMANGPPDPLLETAGADAYNRACLGRILLGRELRRRAKKTGRPEVIAVHPGVIATNITKSGSVVQGIASMVLLTTEQGAQASIYAASCPSTDIPEDTFYFHNKRGWVTLAPDDKASDDKTAEALFEQCNTLCGALST